MKSRKPIIIILGEPNSVFTEILSKVLNKISIKKKIKNPIIIIGSKNLYEAQLKKLKIKTSYKLLNLIDSMKKKLSKKIYLIDVKYNFKEPFEKISYKSKNYIKRCFDIGLNLLNNTNSKIIINGPISKKYFLQKKYPGITEYIHAKSKKKISKNPIMLIFNKDFSVSPITTHIPIKEVSKKITKNIIINNILRIDEFYKKKLNTRPKIALIGINPHCETFDKFNEEKMIIIPAIKNLRKKNINVSGPYSADTFFTKSNIKKFHLAVGMYHDQVLTPFKTIFGFDASNITLGLPFLRMSVDHGPNENMLGKNLSNTKSLENIFNLIHLIK